MSQINFNQIPNETVQQLQVLAQQAGMSVEEYHQQVLALWVSLSNLSPNKVTRELLQTSLQKNLPKIDSSTNDRLIDHLLSFPQLKGYDDEDIFARHDEPMRHIDL